jgi:hypothetical protein
MDGDTKRIRDSYLDSLASPSTVSDVVMIEMVVSRKPPQPDRAAGRSVLRFRSTQGFVKPAAGTQQI